MRRLKFQDLSICLNIWNNEHYNLRIRTDWGGWSSKIWVSVWISETINITTWESGLSEKAGDPRSEYLSEYLKQWTLQLENQDWLRRLEFQDLSICLNIWNNEHYNLRIRTEWRGWSSKIWVSVWISETINITTWESGLSEEAGVPRSEYLSEYLKQ